ALAPRADGEGGPRHPPHRGVRDRDRPQGADQGSHQRVHRAREDILRRRGGAVRQRRPRPRGRDRDLSERGLDAILAELEKTIAVLADGSSPLEELVAAHQRALRLHTEAESSLAKLKARAGEAAKLLSE